MASRQLASRAARTTRHQSLVTVVLARIRDAPHSAALEPGQAVQLGGEIARAAEFLTDGFDRYQERRKKKPMGVCVACA